MRARLFLAAAVLALVVPTAASLQARAEVRPIRFAVALVGKSNLCVRVRTSPPQAGNATISPAGPSGAGTQTVALGADGSATAVFGITQYGPYSGSATVGSTSGIASYTVDGSAGKAFVCPGP
jgi:hypothetical protein